MVDQAAEQRRQAAEKPRHASPVRSEAIESKQHGKSRLGFLRPAAIERAFIALLYTAVVALVILSVFGTFYGQIGKPAPLAAPFRLIQDVAAAPIMLVLAVGVQVVLTLVQYGARQFSRRDKRWWALYLVALGISVYYNVQAYWTPLNALVAWYLAALLIVAGDVLPEFIAVRHD